MAGTRSSTRLASQQRSSPPQPEASPSAAAGSKRKSEAGSSPSAKRGRKTSNKKEQKTIEETMEVDQPEPAEGETVQNGNGPDPEEKKQTEESQTSESSQPEAKRSDTKPADVAPSKALQHGNSEQMPEANGKQSAPESEDKSAKESPEMDDTGSIKPAEQSKGESTPELQQQDKSHNHSADAGESHARDDETPSSILEKGVIYFLFRGRVGIDNPAEVNDIARSYIVLRPIAHGAKIGEGSFGDGTGKCRLLAIPKKVLPISGKDKFMTFVEKSNTTFKELRESFMSASDYATQTAGTRHTPPVTPVAEGVYAITTTGRESHLAYMTTIPQELGEVQKDLGIREQGSFVTSAKNPQYAGPANTNLPQGPGFPKEILDEFRNLRWAPLQPKFLDYDNAQFLLIGESGGIESATEQQPADHKTDEGDPKEELERLEGEDEIRIKHLKGDDAIFADLGISKKEYPQVPSTWND